MSTQRLTTGAGLVLAAASTLWIVGALGDLDPCGLAGDLSSVCQAPPAPLRAGQFAAAAPGALAGVVAGALAMLTPRRPELGKWLRPALVLFAVLALVWVVSFDLGILLITS